MIIRTATIDDLPQIAAVESECFPPAEAATKEEFADRLIHYANHFWLMFDEQNDNKLVAFVDGRPLRTKPLAVYFFTICDPRLFLSPVCDIVGDVLQRRPAVNFVHNRDLRRTAPHHFKSVALKDTSSKFPGSNTKSPFLYSFCANFSASSCESA